MVSTTFVNTFLKLSLYELKTSGRPTIHDDVFVKNLDKLQIVFQLKTNMIFNIFTLLFAYLFAHECFTEIRRQM